MSGQEYGVPISGRDLLPGTVLGESLRERCLTRLHGSSAFAICAHLFSLLLYIKARHILDLDGLLHTSEKTASAFLHISECRLWKPY